MKKQLFLALSLLFLCSCSQEDTSFDQVESQKVPNYEMNDILEFSYKNELYSSKCFDNGDTLIIQDENVRGIYNRIMQNEERHLVVENDSVFTFYDSFDDFTKDGNSLRSSRGSSDRTGNSSSNRPGSTNDRTEYEDIKFQYFHIEVQLANHYPTFLNSPNLIMHPSPDLTFIKKGDLSTFSTSRNGKEYAELTLFQIPKLSKYGLNDRISWASIYIATSDANPQSNYSAKASFQLYEHIDYGGVHLIGGFANVSPKEGEVVSDSQEVKVKFGRDGAGNNTNDRASSLKVFLKLNAI